MGILMLSIDFLFKHIVGRGGGGSSVGRARDSWWGGPGFDSRCGRPTGCVGVSIMWSVETEAMIFHLCGSTWNFRRSFLGPVRDITTRRLRNQPTKKKSKKQNKTYSQIDGEDKLTWKLQEKNFCFVGLSSQTLQAIFSKSWFLATLVAGNKGF